MNKVGNAFLEGTKLRNQSKTPHAKGEEAPPLQWEVRGETMNLPQPESVDTPSQSLRDAIEKRRTVRDYGESPLTLEALSYLLYATQGVQKRGRRGTLRTVPSAGARHAFETLVLVNRVEGLEPGLYRYDALGHRLEIWELGEHHTRTLQDACLGQPMIERSAVTFLWAADVPRMFYRYGERGYRYLFLDAGHVSQNLYLAAQLFNQGACAIAAYDDEAVNDAVGLDGQRHFVAYITSVGEA